MNGHIYVFCGYNSTHRYLRSVEKLQLMADDRPSTSSSQVAQDWQMVPYANLAEEFLARTCPMVC